jgi:hypothetical protein
MTASALGLLIQENFQLYVHEKGELTLGDSAPGHHSPARGLLKKRIRSGKGWPGRL